MMTQGANTATSRLAAHQSLHDRNKVVDRADRAEVIRRHLLAGVATHLVHQIDDIDAVDLQILEQPRLRLNVFAFQLEHLYERGANLFEDLIVRMHVAPRLLVAGGRDAPGHRSTSVRKSASVDQTRGVDAVLLDAPLSTS